MLVVVSYDIVDDRRRARLAKHLVNYGVRVQKSVFECILTAPQYDEMKQKALGYVENDEDSFRIYQICENCVAKIETFGISSVSDIVDVVII